MTLLAINNVRTSHLYCHEAFIGKPTAQQPNPTPVFKSDFLMSPDHPAVAQILATIESVGSAHKWKGDLNWVDLKPVLKETGMLCFKKGDNAIGQPEYKGLLYLKGSNKTRFTVLDGDAITPLVAKDGKPYSGCYVNAKVNIWAQDNGFGRRINCAITGIQFLRHGEAFGASAKVASADEFTAVAASADAPAPAGAADTTGGLL